MKNNSNKNTDWYKLEEEEIFSRLNSSHDGLNFEEVRQRQDKYGKNKLPVKKPLNVFKIIFSQFLNPLIYILLIAGILSFTIGEKKDSFFIFIVIFINATIGAFQEWKAEKSAESLQKLLKISIKAKREKKYLNVDSEELVQGDIVFFESGNKVPADTRIITSNNLRVDESLLTGESVPAEKNPEVLTENNLHISERANMLFAGSVIISGRATGIIVETGINTEIGKIAKVITTLDVSKPPLIYRVEKFSKHISYIIILSCTFIAAMELLRGSPFFEVFFMITALAVAAIPEGLPAAVTVALSVGMSRMSKRNVIIRKLTAVEGLGSCTCIASDKTGTLTVNKQTVKLISLPDAKEYKLTGEGYSGEGNVLTKENSVIKTGFNNNLDEIIKTSIICNEANLYKYDSCWDSNGDAVDIAILAMGYKYGLNPDEINENIESITDMPYESEKAYSAKFYRENGNVKVAVKGAFEVISMLCSKMAFNNNLVDIQKDILDNQANRLACEGYRIISVASGSVMEQKQHYSHCDINSLAFLGFICLIDPLKPESISAVEKCRQAGVKVLMVTGDHPATSMAIGKQLGIAESAADVITGSEIETMDDKSLKEVISQKTVFARVSPLQKLNIVDLLIKSGHFVAVTGDGANDAPALRKANIGVAMGSGTDISKDAASIIVTDDNFSSIVSGIEEGRFTYDNIRKVVYLLISAGTAEIALFLFSLVAGLPIPLIAVQLLWLNLVANGLQGVALAFEKGEPQTMKRPPRNPDENIFNKRMIQEIALSGLTMAVISFIVWFWLLKTGWNEFKARNLVLLLMVLFGNIHVFNCRSELVSAFKSPFKNNIFLIAGVFIAQFIHILSMQIPFMQNILKISPVASGEWVILVVTASLLLVIMEIFKKTKSGFNSRIT